MLAFLKRQKKKKKKKKKKKLDQKQEPHNHQKTKISCYLHKSSLPNQITHHYSKKNNNKTH